MSTLEVSNISDKTTSVPAGYVVNGSAKAWAEFDMSPSLSVGSSLNVSSSTDDGTGLATFNLTTSFVHDEFPAAAGGFVTSSSTINYSNGAYLDTSSAVKFQRENSDGVAHDGVQLSITAHGNLV